MPNRLASPLLAAAVASCCPQEAVKQQPTTPQVAPATPAPQPTTVDVPAPDPKAEAELAARRAYKNPGGMWLPGQLALPAHVEALRAMGLGEATSLADPLADPLAAVVTFGGFCTGSFVSPDGLIVTNHHCAQSALEYNSTKEANLVEHGYLAKSRADEKHGGPTLGVKIATAFRDVTKEMRDGLENLRDPAKRYAELETRYKALVAACEKDRPGTKCDVSSTFHGATYTLTEYQELRDVRIVYAPHRAIGSYGGETDNWMWPRHTGDFAFFRAYVGKDGKPADFAADNVPFKPKHYLKIAKQPLAEHDLVLVAGYPGRTKRLDTYADTKFDVEVRLPRTIERLSEAYDLATELTKLGGNTAIKAGVYKQSIQNGLEYYRGTLAGLTKGDALARKQAAADRVEKWLAEPGREQAKAAVARLEAHKAQKRKTWLSDLMRDRVQSGSDLLGAAHTLVRMAEERPKPDAKRELGYQDRDMADHVAQQKSFAKDFDPVLDRAFFRMHLVRAAKLPPAERPWLAQLIGPKTDDKSIDAFLDRFYKSKLVDEALRLDLLKNGTKAKLAALKDPVIDIALRLAPALRKKEAEDKREAGELALLAPHLGDAQRGSAGGAIAPDANGTLRITYGTVRRFANGGLPFTTAPEVPKKNTGKEPFDAPKALLDAIEQKAWGKWADPTLGTVPVCFLSDVDTTGGNSGSATLNARGELVGLLFDGNKESVSSDVVFNGEITRSIHVDIRYAAWVITQVDKATALATELGLQ